MNITWPKCVVICAIALTVCVLIVSTAAYNIFEDAENNYGTCFVQRL